jgi:exopolysaccharide production protein ExoQ
MRKASGTIRAAAPQYSRGFSRSIKPVVYRASGGAALVVLTILYWLIFYQNLPGTLNGMASNATYIEANSVDRVLKVCMIAMSLFVIASRWSVVRTVGRNINLGAAALLLMCLLSAAWSIEPTSTVLRFVSLACIYLVCFAVPLTGWHRLRFQQLTLPPLMFILIGSLVVGFIMPDRIAEIGTDIAQRGAWHGITHSKNEFGMVSSLGAIICVNLWLARERRSYWSIAGAAIAFTCLILSRSNTSLLATLLAIGFMFLVMRVPVIKDRFVSHVTIALAVLILFSELAIQQVVPGVSILTAPITSLTGKDTSFSARTVIWNVIKDHIQNAPWLGTGYGAYWIPNSSSPSWVFVSLMFFYPTESHNGYLEIVNDLGLVGLFCLLAFICIYIRESLLLMRLEKGQGALYLGLMFQQMVMNMSESEWFSRSSTFAVFILAITCLSRGLSAAQQRALGA